MDRYRVTPTLGHGAHSPRHIYLSSQHLHAAPCGGAAARRGGGAELGIFTAERYFSGDKCDPSVPALHHDVPQLVGPVDAASQSGRTAVSSEASWNSRSGLLSSTAVAAKVKGGNVSDQRGGKKAGSGQRWGLFGRDCPCAGKKSVTVDVAAEPKITLPAINTRFDHSNSAMEDSTSIKANELLTNEEIAKIKITSGNWAGSGTFPTSNSIFAQSKTPSFAAFPPDVDRRVVSSGGFSFPVLGTRNVAAMDEPPRESLEVFRPIDEDTVVLTDPPALAVNRGAGGFPRAPPVVEEEAMSDTSSDLFDLESFAASSSYPTSTYRRSRRNSADEAASAAEPALSECMYPPSEVSVVWSVATAEGGAFDAASVANFSSAASACCIDEFRFAPEGGNDGFTAAMTRNAVRKKSGGGGGFLNSCRCEKAVSVGPTPVRVDVEHKQRRSSAAEQEAMKPSGLVGLGNGAVARCHPGRVHMPVRT